MKLLMCNFCVHVLSDDSVSAYSTVSLCMDLISVYRFFFYTNNIRVLGSFWFPDVCLKLQIRDDVRVMSCSNSRRTIAVSA